jgi:hypothetical protein
MVMPSRFFNSLPFLPTAMGGISKKPKQKHMKRIFLFIGVILIAIACQTPTKEG